jgi:GlpG protein
MIGSIPQHPDGAARAERFSDYLVAQSVENMVEESSAGDAWVVWVEHDDDLARAKSELDAFLQNPADSKYDAAGAAKKVRQEQAQKAKRRRTQYIDYGTRWGQARQWVAPVTIVLIALSVMISLGTNSLGFGRQHRPSINLFTFAPGDVEQFKQWWVENAPDEDAGTAVFRYTLSVLRAGQVWRVLTPIFLHFGILHLLFNMFWLRDLGGMIEIQRGSGRLLAIVLACALLSNVAQFLWMLPHPPGFGGMSGVVYGLFAYIWVKQRYEPHLGLGVRQETVWIMVAWLVISMTGVAGPVANAAHVSGLLTGAAIAYAPIGYRRAMRRSRM